MTLCPLCNGLRKIHVVCTECESEMKDMGKAMDYDDEYSAYMDINTLKQNDGFPDSLKKGQCPHLMKCLNCNHDEVILVQE
ncbi:hypothetical protein ACIQD3_07315 [Peribacillus loiseleuriae]|uniref:hypothetical protein n=1 Tax=Peribacillus loiseleuriae TaxID=1679170 RepID=UPI00380F9092